MRNYLKLITTLAAAGALLLQGVIPAAAASGLIEVTPGNMLFLDVTDASGNSVEGVKVSLYNSAGTEVGGIRNDSGFFTSNNSGIDGTEVGERYNYDIPWSTFTPYVAPQTLHSVNICRDDWDDDYYTRYQNQPIYVGSGDPYKVQLFSYDASQAVALTVPANQFGIYVDPKWAKRTVGAYITTPSMDRYINYAPFTGILADAFTLKPGTTTLIEAFDPNYFGKTGLILPDGSGGGGSAHEVSVSSAATQYVLCRLPLCQLCPYFREDGNYVDDNLLYDLRQDTQYTSAILTIQSGAMINAVIPDSSGYVQFYLDKATREYTLDYCYHFSGVPNDHGTHSSGGSGFGYSGIAANIMEYFLQPIPLLQDEILLTHVPAGNYTLVYDNIPRGYTAPKTTTLTVTNSKEIQYVQLVLGDVPLLGDVDSNKQINAADAALLLKAASAVGTGSPSGLNASQELCADVNSDGAFNAADAALILQYAAYTGTGGRLILEEYLKKYT